MSKWELQGDWPVGQFIVPKGTIIDSEGNGRDLPSPPMNSKALDQAAADWLSTTYPHHLHELHAAKGVTLRKLINV